MNALLSGTNYLKAVRALEETGFEIFRQGRKHVVMSDGSRFLTIPRKNPVHSLVMEGIIRDAGLTPAEFTSFL